MIQKRRNLPSATFTDYTKLALQGEIVSRYTTPDLIFRLGMVEMMGELPDRIVKACLKQRDEKEHSPKKPLAKQGGYCR